MEIRVISGEEEARLIFQAVSRALPLPEAPAVLMDVGTISARLGKPLTARLMPLPGKKAGDRVHFDFDYFADSRVMALDAQKISSPLRDEDSIRFTPRKPGEF